MTETITYRHNLTDEEKLEMSKELANVQLKLSDVEDEKKASASHFKAEIDTLQEKVKLLARNVRDGWMNKTTKCKKIKSIELRRWEWVDDHGAIVKTEPLKA